MQLIRFALAGLVLAFLATSTLDAQALPAGVTTTMVQEGQQVFVGAGICSACHGPDATGAIGPDLTDAEWLIGMGGYEELVAQIVEGVTAADATNPLFLPIRLLFSSLSVSRSYNSFFLLVWL